MTRPTTESADESAPTPPTADPFFPLRRNGVDPVPELATVRDREPVRKLQFPFGISAWLVSGYDEVKTVLADSAGFSNDFANLSASIGDATPAQENPGGLGMVDPPTHTRLRKMLTPEFTVRRLARLTPRITEIVDELLDAMAATGPPVDLVDAFAMPLPSLVICELLDVPYPDREAFTKFSGARFDILGGTGTGLDAISDSLAYMRTLVAQQRRNPGDGLLGMLIQKFGDDIDDDELAGLADGILVGGHETTASMLALGAITLLSDQRHVALMQRGDDAAIHSAVEELLRFLTVVQVAFPRFANDDIDVAGTRISAGEMVLCSLSAADRDPRLGDGLDQFDPTRATTKHLAFGHGIHRCIGSELARMELRIAYPALVNRFPNLRIDVPTGEIAFREYSVVHGVETLPVSW